MSFLFILANEETNLPFIMKWTTVINYSFAN